MVDFKFEAPDNSIGGVIIGLFVLIGGNVSLIYEDIQSEYALIRV